MRSGRRWRRSPRSRRSASASAPWRCGAGCGWAAEMEAGATTAGPHLAEVDSRRAYMDAVAALVRRSRNELLRVPGAAIPGVLAPTIFFLGLTAVFGSLTLLGPEFGTDKYQSFIIPVSLLQGAGFTG